MKPIFKLITVVTDRNKTVVDTASDVEEIDLLLRDTSWERPEGQSASSAIQSRVRSIIESSYAIVGTSITYRSDQTVFTFQIYKLEEDKCSAT